MNNIANKYIITWLDEEKKNTYLRLYASIFIEVRFVANQSHDYIWISVFL